MLNAGEGLCTLPFFVILRATCLVPDTGADSPSLPCLCEESRQGRDDEAISVPVTPQSDAIPHSPIVILSVAKNIGVGKGGLSLFRKEPAPYLIRGGLRGISIKAMVRQAHHDRFPHRLKSLSISLYERERNKMGVYINPLTLTFRLHWNPV